MTEAIFIFPFQLFANHPSLKKNKTIYLLEDSLFFLDPIYPSNFHKQKLILLRASLKYYQDYLERRGYKTKYIEAKDLSGGEKSFEKLIKKEKITSLTIADPVDFILEKRLHKAAIALEISLKIDETPAFFLQKNEIDELMGEKEHYAFTPFYIKQRKRLRLLLTDTGKPIGGKWSYDVENRKKIPKNLEIPTIPTFAKNSFVKEAIIYVEKHFGKNFGKGENFWFPTTHAEAKKWLEDFIVNRLVSFGPFEDAIDKDQLTLFHSVLSSSINIGLLTPNEAIDRVVSQKNIPLNSLEGFIRQIIGWREFIRGIYQVKGVHLRNSNFWNLKRKLPKAFYDATTGIQPIDDTIKKISNNAYCHHIERLMLLGNFMLLCEIQPNEVYQWFMEVFIDAYDWVMVPNVYGMSQYAAGGLMTTKPYISSSNYVKKMSNYPNGPWVEIWNSLFWRFMHKNLNFFKSQQRLGLLAQQIDKMDKDQLHKHYNLADKFLSQL